MADLKSTTEEKVPVFVNPKTKAGNPSKLDGKAILSIVEGGATAEAATDDEIATYEAGGNPGLVGFVVSEDKPGTSSWKVDGDSDLGEGVTSIVDGGTYVYNDPQAENLGVTGGAPVPKVAA